MARPRRRARTTLKRPASAFAPGQARDGKGIQWEYIMDQPIPITAAAFFPTAVRSVGAIDTKSVTILPGNVLRGTVTLERIRGTLEVYFSSVELAASFDNWFIHVQLQLVPLRDGDIVDAATLSPSNAADQESNKIIWQRVYYPRAGTTITSPGALEVHESNYIGMEVDVKVKRRFDRATWALILVADCESNSFPLHSVAGQFRALFRAADGV